MPAILYWVVILTSARLLLATIAMRRVAESEELRAGKITLQGEVLAEDESTPPVAVEIEQEGTEWFVKKKKRWAHGWKENGRRVTAKPFRLLLASGEIVDIMAGDRATVAVPLSGEPHGECKHRTLRAEICHGQRIYAHGMLAVPTETLGSDEAGSAYRDTPPSRPILRAPDDEQLWLGSEAPSELHRSGRRFTVRWLLVVLAAIAVMQIGCFGGYHLRSQSGQSIPARVMRKKIDGGKTKYYILAAKPEGALLGMELWADKSCYHRVRAGQGIPLIRVRGLRFITQIGSRVTVNYPLCGLAAFFAWALGMIYWGSHDRTRPWYLKEKYKVSGEGRLALSPIPSGLPDTSRLEPQ